MNREILENKPVNLYLNKELREKDIYLKTTKLSDELRFDDDEENKILLMTYSNGVMLFSDGSLKLPNNVPLGTRINEDTGDLIYPSGRIISTEGITKKTGTIVLSDDYYKMSKIYEGEYTHFIYVPDDLVTNNLTTCKSMFYDCARIMELPDLDLPHATDLSYMFTNCVNLLSVPRMVLGSAIVGTRAFSNCTSLENVTEFDTSTFSDMTYMFADCYKLTGEFPFVLDLSGIFNPSHLLSMFEGTNITKVKITNIDIDIKDSVTSDLIKGDDSLEIEWV